MLAPVRNLTKAELIWLGTHKCKSHRHSYLSHYNCYLNDDIPDCPFKEKVGILDIETSGFKADFSYMFSYCIKELDGDIIGRALTTKEIRTYKFDENLMQELVADLRKFHRIVVFYGGDYKFDLPFVRSRALKYGLDFPLYKEIYTTDLYPIVKKKLKLRNNKLATACRFLNIGAKEHYLNPTIWQKANAGDKASLAYIFLHNSEDVISTEELYKRLIGFVRKSKTSI